MLQLKNVVVSTGDVAAWLVDRGTRQRNTYFTLDKGQPSFISDNTLAKGKQLVGRENCSRAYDSVVPTNPLFDGAVKSAFGNCILAETEEQAKILVDRHRGIGKMTVTKSCMSFHANGTLSGGQDPSGVPMEEVNELQMHMRARADAHHRVRQIDEQLNKHRGREHERHEMERKVEDTRSRLENLGAKLKGNESHQLAQDIQRLGQEIAAHEVTVVEGEKRIGELTAKVAEYEHKIENADEIRAKAIKEVDAALAKARKQLESHRKQHGKRDAQLAALQAEITGLEEAVVELTTKVRESEAEVADLVIRRAAAKEVLAEKDADMIVKDAALSEHRAHTEKIGKEIQRLKNELTEFTRTITASNEEIAQSKENIDQMKASVKTAKTKNDRLNAQNPWIAAEKDTFGVAGTEFHFTNVPKFDHGGNDVDRFLAEIAEMKAEFTALEGDVNEHAMNQLQSTEDEADKLTTSAAELAGDKLKLEETIAKLDAKARQAIIAAHIKVSKDFGEIFSLLLPTAIAELRPHKNGDATTGLVVRVGFNDKWKDSLTELSGGQRSLVALSFVLAMLKFRPAPLYILDEVDAALDMSHTQNIGAMIKTHFQNSQFIIVSLKDGMFNNANVLYQTKFVDGCSTVTRTGGTKENNAPQPATKRARR